MRALLLIAASLILAFACVDVTVYPLSQFKPFETSTAVFRLHSECQAEVKLIAKISNATVSGAKGFDSVVSNLLILERELKKGDLTAFATLVPTSDRVSVHISLYINGRLSKDEVTYLGTPPCVRVYASSLNLRDALKGFEVPENAKALDVLVINQCDERVSSLLSVRFPLGKAMLFAPYYKCDEYETIAYTVKECAKDELGTPITICVKSSNTGPFKTIYVKKSAQPVVRKCTDCVPVETANGTNYVCSKCETYVREPEVLEEISVREPRCFETRCAKWNEIARTLRVCREWSGKAIRSNVEVIGNYFSLEVHLDRGEAKEYLIPFVLTQRYYVIGSFSRAVEVPVAVIEYGGSEVRVNEAIPNYGYVFTVLLTVLSLLSISYFLMKVVGG
ncbi:hypothetical protein EYM_06000 [Ignicoccus islandicus DSM 13165]|uniref:Transmembrane protein n=1 Tax=Ignicoccus islandicus DSM 13165 TaxID=940295 RepID=A0A0U2WNU9_9CREN|nr:hypothetical protein [Ignicoccus islandicus]ALU12641.1 hypothetical protein EYM_06000 [Ignicoccus islandicus DSM 13165]